MSSEASTAAYSRIKTLLTQVDHLLQQATDIADEHNVSFSYDGPGYGMGGWYEPMPLSREKAIAIIESGIDLTPENRKRIADALKGDTKHSSGESGWQSSSSFC